MSSKNKINVLTYTNLYPNNINPNFAVFVKERAQHIKDFVNLRVVAPVPYFPPINICPTWYQYSQIVKYRIQDEIKIFHPRFFITPKILMSMYGYFMYYSVIGFLRKMKKGFDFDLIDAQYAYPDGFAALLVAKRLKVPITLTVRGSDINYFTTLPKIRERIIFTLKNVDKIISVSQALKDTIVQLDIPETKVVVIQNGVDTTMFHPINNSRNDLGLPKNRKIILSVGNVIKTKGHHLIIKALSIIRKKDPQKQLPHLIIIGDGNYKTKLIKLIKELDLKDYVTFTGRLQHNTIIKWYNACDIFCLASYHEGLPNVLREAMACGKPVVATNVGGIPEIITSDDYGFLVSELDPGKIALTLNNALNKKWDTKKIITYASSMDWKSSSKKLNTVFQSVVDARKEL